MHALDARSLRRWCRLAAEALGRTRSEIDALNVFPVPDGDTGTNLHLTLLAAAEALDELPEDAGTAATWRGLAQGALLGARGNSGVILSQMLRGLSEALADQEDGGGSLGAALRHAARLAHAAVAHPVEGTILSVLRAAGDAGAERDGGDLRTVARAAAAAARDALRDTTGQLDVLGRNGVVDAGGAGLCVVLDVLAAVVSEEFPERYEVPPRAAGAAAPVQTARRLTGEERGYEVMYLLETAGHEDRGPDAVSGLREALDALGDSLVIVGGDGLWNVHVHVDDAGAAIEAGLAAGRPYRIRVTYLSTADAGHPPCTGRGVVAVTAGDGLAELFAGCGAKVVRRRPGSAPTLSAMLEAIVPAGDEVVVLPNDEAAIPIAEAAAQRAREEAVRVSVVPTKASVQGLAALAVHDPLRRFDEDVIAMTRAAGATRFGHLAEARQEAVTSAGICRAGDVLGLIEGDVVVIGAGLADVGAEILDRMLSGGGELVTLITGAGAVAGTLDKVRAHLDAAWPDVEVVAYAGGHERYPLLLGVE